MDWIYFVRLNSIIFSYFEIHDEQTKAVYFKHILDTTRHVTLLKFE